MSKFNNLTIVSDSKNQWESVLDALPQLICLVDRKGRIVRANKTLEKLGFGKVESATNKPIHEILHPNCTDVFCLVKEKCEDCFNLTENGHIEEWSQKDWKSGIDFSYCLGRTLSSISEEKLCNEQIFVVVSDISEQIKAKRVLSDYNQELELELIGLTSELSHTNFELENEVFERKKYIQILSESEKKYNCLVETTLTGLYIIQDNKIVFCNNRFAEIFGYEKEDIKDLKIERLFLTDDGSMKSLLDTQSAFAGNDKEHTVAGITKDGFVIWLRRYLKDVELSQETLVIGNIIDITKQKITEDALRLSQYELQLLSEKLLKSEEAQRKFIAQELHDSVGQSIYAIKLGLENAVQEFGLSLPTKFMTRIQSEIKKLQGASEEIRNIAMNLRPAMLDDLGLLATINWFTREFSLLLPKLSISKDFNVQEKEIPTDLKVVIFRLIQEAINNISKHASATKVIIEITLAKSQLSLKVSDNGIGFMNDKSFTGKGFGLSSMRERVKNSEGEFIIDSEINQGTNITATWRNLN